VPAFPATSPPTNRYILAFTLVAAFINPVPSRAMFHPLRWRSDPIADDMMGSGLEARECEPLRRVAGCEQPGRHVAQQWRDLAQRVRRLAALSTGEERARLLEKAVQYEDRARRWEEQQKSLGEGA
jgi:hypothetical protein